MNESLACGTLLRLIHCFFWRAPRCVATVRWPANLCKNISPMATGIGVYFLHGSRSSLRPFPENLRFWGGRGPSLLSSWCPGGVWVSGCPTLPFCWCPGGVPAVSRCLGVPVYFPLGGVAAVSGGVKVPPCPMHFLLSVPKVLNPRTMWLVWTPGGQAV